MSSQVPRSFSGKTFFCFYVLLLSLKTSVAKIYSCELSRKTHFAPCPREFIIHLSRKIFLSLEVINFLLLCIQFIKCDWVGGVKLVTWLVQNLVHDWDPEIWWNAIISFENSGLFYEWLETFAGNLFTNSPSSCSACASSTLPMLECTFRFPDSAYFMYSDFPVYVRACNVLVLTLTPWLSHDNALWLILINCCGGVEAQNNYFLLHPITSGLIKIAIKFILWEIMLSFRCYFFCHPMNDDITLPGDG